MISLTLPWPSADLSPNGGAPQWRRIKAKKAAKNYAWVVTKGVMSQAGIAHKSAHGKFDLQYTFHPLQGRGRDDDNFIHRMKPSRDGIAMALGIDDKNFRTLPVIWGTKKNGTVDVVLTKRVSE